jgi:hypothetical protein
MAFKMLMSTPALRMNDAVAISHPGVDTGKALNFQRSSIVAGRGRLSQVPEDGALSNERVSPAIELSHPST